VNLGTLVPPPIPKEEPLSLSSKPSELTRTGSALLALALIYTATAGMIHKGIPVDRRHHHLLSRITSRFVKGPFFALNIPSWSVGTMNSICLAFAGGLESLRTGNPNVVSNIINVVFLVASAHGLHYALRYRTSESNHQNPPVKFSALEKGCFGLAVLGTGVVLLSALEQFGIGAFSKYLGMPAERLGAYAGIINIVVSNLPYLWEYVSTCSWRNVTGEKKEPPRLQQLLYFGAALTGIVGLPFASIQAEGLICWSRVIFSTFMLSTALTTYGIYSARSRSAIIKRGKS
jgi:hypothetical protein